MIEEALQYSLLGWYVFPTGKHKRPVLRKDKGWKDENGLGGFKIASKDPLMIKEMFNAAGKDAYGIGLHCGPSGLIVLDADVYKETTPPETIELVKSLPDTLRASTPSGGTHYYFKYPKSTHVIIGSRSNGLPPNIDIRAYGGYVVLPGSKLNYQWENEETNIAELPDSLLEILIAANQEPEVTYSEDGYTRDELVHLLRHVPYTEEESGNRLTFDLHECLNPLQRHKSGAAVMLNPDGSVGYKCHHNSCSGWGWQQAKQSLYRGLYDPKFEGLIEADDIFSKAMGGVKKNKDIPFIEPLPDHITKIQDVGLKIYRAKWLDMHRGDSDIVNALLGYHLKRDSSYKASSGWFYWSGHNWQKNDDMVRHWTAIALTIQAEYQIDTLKDRQEKLGEMLLAAEEKLEKRRQKNKERKKKKPIAKHLDRISKIKKRIEEEKRELTAVRKKRQQVNQSSQISARLDFLKGLANVHSSYWDNQAWKLPVKNGVINLQDFTFENGKPEDYLTKAIPVDWEPGARAPRWEQFINEITLGDKELGGFLKRLFGYALLGEAIEAVFPILWGESGRNGKSVLLETISAVLGELAGTVTKDVIISSRHYSAGASPHIVALKGMRLAFYNELSTREILNEALIKKLSGNDTIRGRGLYQDEIEFNPSHTLMLATNHKPYIRADDNAIWARVLLIPFNARFVDNPQQENEYPKDIHLKSKLLKEAPGILNWLLDGFKEWRDNGLQIPQSISDNTKLYRLEEDTLHLFVRDRVQQEKDNWVSMKHLYKAYKEYCEEGGYLPLGPRNFKADIDRHLPFAIRKRRKEGQGLEGVIITSFV